MLPFIITGLVTGAVYGLAAVGLVLTYKTSGIFNFAYGAIATIAAYLFYELFVQSEWSWQISAAVVVLVIGPLLGLLLELMARRLDGTSLAMRVACTVGLLIAVQAVIVLHYGTLETRIVPNFLSEGSFTIGDTTVTGSQLITVIFAVVTTAGLYAFFRFARQGMAMRAVVDNAELLDLAGTSAVRVRRSAWVIGTMFAAASGVLFSSLLPLDPLQLTLLVVPAFGAAAIGGFASLPLSFAGGLIIGVLASLSTKWFTSGVLLGLPTALPFLVLFVVLLVYPRGRLVERAPVTPRVRSTWSAPMPLQVGGGVLLLAVLLLAPAFAGIHIGDWTMTMAVTILFLSLGLLVRTSGQVSLGHVAFAAIGGAAFCHLANDALNLPWALALLGAGLIAIPVGAMLAIPAIRVTGLYLALATFGFAVFIAYMFYTSSVMFGDTGAGLNAPRPSGLDGDDAFYYVTLGFAVATSAFLIALNRSRLGRLLRGMADSPTALSTSGVSVNVTRVIVFCISAFVASIAGALMAMTLQRVSVETYPPLLGLTYLALIMIVVGREPWYAITAAAALVLVPSYVTDANTSQWLQLAFGVMAMAIALTPARLQQAEGVKRAVDRLFRRGPVKPRAVPRPAVRERIAAGSGLQVEDLRVRYGGLVAVDGISLEAPAGRITGLIGPNGAGKTTTFNACSGLASGGSTAGRVLFEGADVTRLSASGRALQGLGRTFQKTELFDSLAVWDNVAMGAEGARAGSNPLNQLLSTSNDREEVAAAAAEAIKHCGLSELVDTPVAVLSTGQRRLVELARCLAGRFRILLLDEPTSGLDRAETARFGQILRETVAERGEGVLVVEHDMSFVMEVCDYVYVLDFGKLIFAGTPAEVRASPVVRAAYLGDEAVEEAVS